MRQVYRNYSYYIKASLAHCQMPFIPEKGGGSLRVQSQPGLQNAQSEILSQKKKKHNNNNNYFIII